MDTDPQALAAMRNIATYHRQHERYYTMNQLETAADPRFQAAGCPDLNALPAIVWPRFQIIVTDWRGAREMELVGKLLGVAVECLEKIDFSPPAVRASREHSGKMLRTAGCVLDLAARLLARSAANLGENRRDMDAVSGRTRPSTASRVTVLP